MQEQDISRERYLSFIEELGREAGIAEPHKLGEHCNLVINHVTFTLMYADFVHPDRAMLFIDFGKPPSENRDLVLQRLLETNLYMACDDDVPVFSFNAETGNVVLTSRLSLSTVTAASVLKLMHHLSDYVKSWRQSLFLTPEERSGKARQTRPASKGFIHPLQNSLGDQVKRAAGGQ